LREVSTTDLVTVIQFHLDGLRKEAYDVPEPHSYSTYAEVPA